MGTIGRKSRLRKKARKGFRGYPKATVAFYGPTADFASKVVVGIFRDERAGPDLLERWFATERDLRVDPEIEQSILALLERESVKSVVMTDGLIGCPHEEGVDYPKGEWCPQCPYWKGRDRFSGERIH